MNVQIIASTCALIISAGGVTSAMAESFNDRGMEWAMASPMPTVADVSKPQTLPPEGSFASSWGSGITPSLYRGPTSSSAWLDVGRSCDLAPRIGFNQRNTFPMC